MFTISQFAGSYLRIYTFLSFLDIADKEGQTAEY
jgi:hypothetical protein